MHALLLVLLMTVGKCVYGAAVDLWCCQDKVVVYDGPAGTGKTHADLLKADFVARKYPGSRQLFLRQTRTSMTQSVLVEFEDGVLPYGDPVKSGASRPQRQSYRYPNGSEIVVGGLDNPDRIMSTQYDRIYIFEAAECSEDAIANLLTRMRNGKTDYAQLILECNPSHPNHWIKRWFESGRATRIRSTHRDNPRWYDQTTGELTPAGEDYIGKTLGLLTGHKRKRLLEGVWAGSEGVVYDTFDHAVNVRGIKRESWERTYIGVDVGYTNPFAVLLVREDGDGRLHIEREFYKSGHAPERRVDAIRDMGPSDHVIVDPESADLRAMLSAAGLPVMQADNTLLDGIDRVQARLRKSGDGLPRLTVDPSCTNTIAEFESYEWAKTRDDSLRDMPVKRNDHAMDALRYVVNQADAGGEFGITIGGGEPDNIAEWGGWGD